MNASALLRFEAKVIHGDVSEHRPDLGPCWLWTSNLNTHGYPTLHYDGRPRYAHRLAYEHFVGPINDGLTLDHLCRVPACVNPAHLEPVTLRENVLRGTSPSAQQARRTHCIRDHEFTPENTAVYAGRRQCRICMRIRDRRRRPRSAA